MDAQSGQQTHGWFFMFLSSQKQWSNIVTCLFGLHVEKNKTMCISKVVYHGIIIQMIYLWILTHGLLPSTSNNDNYGHIVKASFHVICCPNEPN